MRVTVISTQTEAVSGESKFREDLKIYFPDLYKFWSLFQFDPHYKEVLEGILEMTEGLSGSLRIDYQGGRVNNVVISKSLTTNTKTRTHY